jgi:hypothetical protein
MAYNWEILREWYGALYSKIEQVRNSKNQDNKNEQPSSDDDKSGGQRRLLEY